MHRKFAGLVFGLAAAAAAGFRGVAISVEGSSLDRYATKPKRSTAQCSDARFPKHPPGTVAQAKRSPLKAKNRGKHRRACRS